MTTTQRLTTGISDPSHPPASPGPLDLPVSGGETPPDARMAPRECTNGERSRANRIRNAAYRRFLERGEGPGDDVQDWLDAEAEIDREDD